MRLSCFMTALSNNQEEPSDWGREALCDANTTTVPTAGVSGCNKGWVSVDQDCVYDQFGSWFRER